MRIRTPFVVLAAFTLSATSQATLFFDEGAWRAAVGDFSNETWEGYASGTQVDIVPSLGLDFRMLTAGTTNPTVQSVSQTGGETRSGTQILLNDDDFSLPGDGNIVADVTGMQLDGIGYWNTGGDDTTILKVYDASNNLIEMGESGQSGTFIGIVPSVPITTIEITPGSQGNGYFTVDDMQVSTFVPEPASCCVLLASLCLLRARQRR